MDSHRLPYADAASTPEMVADCREVGRELHFPPRYDRHATEDGPANGPEDRPADAPDPRAPVMVRVSDELSELADGLEVSLSR